MLGENKQSVHHLSFGLGGSREHYATGKIRSHFIKCVVCCIDLLTQPVFSVQIVFTVGNDIKCASR